MFDSATRNLLASFVARSRRLLCGEYNKPGGEITSLLQTYGIQPDGTVAKLESLPGLDQRSYEVATTLRELLAYKRANSAGVKAWGKYDPHVYDLIQEQAFTVLNRLCALRMAEERGILPYPVVSKGMSSDGFELYEMSADKKRLTREERYESFLFSIFDELSLDLQVLFDRFATESLFSPRPDALAELLEEINAPALAPLWSEDETIGWVYQYWNSKEERKAMRDASDAPRNSRELAVRNQFFTPRYVVEFLTDNTLGRIWYEMTKGKTRLKDQCRYLVRRPSEIFLRSLDVAYRGIYGTNTPVPEDLTDYDAFAALYRGDLKPAAAGKEGFLALAGGALSEESFQSAVGEPWDQHGNDCIDALRRAILEDAEHPKKSDLVSVWAAMSQFIEGSQIGSPYATESRSKLERYFRELLKGMVETEGLSQEELLKQPVLIPHRPLKDPREICLLDPACGSMHFGLYAFDLYEAIYEEAWDLARSGSIPEGADKSFSDFCLLTSAFSSKEAFLREVPRLIIEHNIHGIDIDPRAVQIAGLSLWLRAQRSWKKQKLDVADRPRVRRSNIVCAEPMPGSHEMLEEFVKTLDPPLLGELVKTVFEKMQLAGEVGSLLKIQEEIRTAIDTARKEWLKQQDDLLTRTDGSQEEFFDTAEQQVIDALRSYAEQADADSYQRRLFAEDAARGFAFIDLCRKRYDAVVMNPPFGESALNTTTYLKSHFPEWNGNILCAFVRRMFDSLARHGKMGAIFDRTMLVKKTYQDFRRANLTCDNRISELCDLGWEVLEANVEVSSFILTKDFSGDGFFFDVRNSSIDQKPFDLLLRIREPVARTGSSVFSKLPNAIIGYDFPQFLLRAFKGSNGLIDSGSRAFTGHQLPKERHFRLFWEVKHESCKVSCHAFKGGSFFLYVASMREWLIAESDLDELSVDKGMNLRNKTMHFKQGVCYGERGDYLNVYVLPRGMYFTLEGPAIPCADRDKALDILAYLNSPTIIAATNRLCGQHKTAGYVNLIPFRRFHLSDQDRVSLESAINLLLQIRTIDETQLLFRKPELGHSVDEIAVGIAGTMQHATHAALQAREEIEERVRDYLGLSAVERSDMASFSDALPKYELPIEDVKSVSGASVYGSNGIFSYCLGTSFGRWDIRYATGERQPPELPDPFDPLPVCPPGLLQNASGLPAEPADVASDYPLRISWPGILVDDEGRTDDIVTRVRAAITVIWKDRAEAIELEACEILDVKSLRDYFRKPTAFFADHLKRYSKSRRQAPIYWPLSTESGSYTLWIYYHRLTPDILFACITSFVAPKQEQTERTLARLGAKNPRTSTEEKDYEAAAALIGELATFRAELERLAKIWKPNLNDGVQITAAPLWSLFRLPKWQKTLKETWQELEKGDYDWSHLSLSLWPERVIPKCAKDRSLAIAHGFDEDLWEEVTEMKGKKSKTTSKPRKDAAEIAARLVAERNAKG